MLRPVWRLANAHVSQLDEKLFHLVFKRCRVAEVEQKTSVTQWNKPPVKPAASLHAQWYYRLTQVVCVLHLCKTTPYSF